MKEKAITIAAVLPEELEDLPYSLAARVQDVIDKFKKAKASAAPIYAATGAAAGTVSVVLSPFPQGTTVPQVYWRISNNVANFQRKRLFNNTGQKGYVVASDGKKWYWGTNTNLTVLFPEL